MKSIHFLFFILCLALLNGCVETYRDVKLPDIKAMRTNNKELKFDIQYLKNNYGVPPIEDKEKKVIGYYAVYRMWQGYTIFDLEPSGTEYWYLILTPVEDTNYYTGERYRDWFSAERANSYSSSMMFPKVEPLKDIEAIRNCKIVKPDYYYDKTKAIDYKKKYWLPTE